MAINKPASPTSAQQQPAVASVPDGPAGDDTPPPVQGDLAPARQKAAEAEQKRLRGDHISAVYKFDEALAAIDRAHTSGSGAEPLLNWCEAHRGASLGALGLVNRALPLFKQVLNRNPTYAWAWAQYGEAWRVDLRDRLSADPAMKSEFDDGAVTALNAFSTAIQLKKDYAWARAHRGALMLLIYWYYTTHDLSLAELPDALLTIDPKSSEPVAQRLARQIKDDLDRALELEPTYAWANLFVALFENLFDRQDESTSTLKSILAFGTSNNLPILTSLAMSHVYGGELEQASRFADQILARDPENATGFYVRAKVLQKSGGKLEREVLESFRTRLEVAKDRIEVMLEDLQDGPPPRAELCKRRGASLDNVAIRTRLLGARQLAAKDDRLKSPADKAWTEQCKVFSNWKRS